MLRYIVASGQNATEKLYVVNPYNTLAIRLKKKTLYVTIRISIRQLFFYFKMNDGKPTLGRKPPKHNVLNASQAKSIAPKVRPTLVRHHKTTTFLMRHKHWVRPLGQALPTPWPCFKSIYYTPGTRWLMRKCGASVSIGCDTRLAMASHGRPWPAMGKTEKAERPNVHQKSSKDRAVPKVVQSRPRVLKGDPKGSLTAPEGFLQAPRRRPKASQGNPNVRKAGQAGL